MKMWVLLLTVCLVSRVSSAPSVGCGQEVPAVPRPGHHHRLDISVSDPGLGEVTRQFSLHLPAHYDTENNQPVPLVLDYHGWTSGAHDQMANMPWKDVADMDKPGFIYVAMQGMNDVLEGGSYASWNVSNSAGELGAVCEPSLHHDYPCYTSCGGCQGFETSCDWTSCHDDVVFTQTVIYHILDTYCVDTEHIHMSGISNGGMFIWTRAMESLSASLASVGPVGSAPLRGYNFMPDAPLNIIDMHGLNDRTIPFSPDRPGNLGAGPDDTVQATDGWYYHTKMIHLNNVLQSMNCNMESEPYPTHMDGVHGWTCQSWTGCDQGKQVKYQEHPSISGAAFVFVCRSFNVTVNTLMTIPSTTDTSKASTSSGTS